MVCSLLLQGGCEGPALILCAARLLGVLRSYALLRAVVAHNRRHIRYQKSLQKVQLSVFHAGPYNEGSSNFRRSLLDPWFHASRLAQAPSLSPEEGDAADGARDRGPGTL